MDFDAGMGFVAVFFALGIVMCATIIGIPFGVQFFKLSISSIYPRYL